MHECVDHDQNAKRTPPPLPLIPESADSSARRKNGRAEGSAEKQSIEARIGLYWLHRLGIVSLVLGFVFFITCTFQYWSPQLKLLIGFASAAALIVIGEIMAANKMQKWFAHGLSAGGWSLAYFSAYAAHYIPAVRVIDSLPLETALLSLVAAGSLFSAIRASSEIMAIYSVTLASLTILITGPGLFSDVSFLIIATTTAILGNRQSWRKLFAFGLAACYLGHLYCCLSSPLSLSDNLYATIFLSGIWLTFCIGIGWTARVPDSARNFYTVLACLNAASFASLLAFFTDKSWGDLHQILLLGSGIIYLGLSRWLQQRDQEQLRTVHSLLGLFLLNVSKAMHFSGLTLLSVDVAQIALLAVVGLKYKIRSFQWFALALSGVFLGGWLSGAVADVNDTVFGVNAFHYMRLGLFAAGVLFGVSQVHSRAGKILYCYFYHGLSTVVSAVLIAHIISPSWQALACALLAVVNYKFYVLRKDDYYGAISVIQFAASAIICGGSINQWERLPVALQVAAYYYAHAFGRPYRQKDMDICWVFAFSANVLLTIYVLTLLPNDYVSLGLGIEGMALLLAGLILPERFFRYCGLMVLALLTGKLLIIDMAHYNTLERILSFLGAGFVFLLSSYAYGKFTHSFDDQSEEAVEVADLPDENRVGDIGEQYDLKTELRADTAGGSISGGHDAGAFNH